MRFGRWLSCIAAMAMLASPLVAAEKASHPTRAGQVYDVTISKQGNLVGQVVSAAGQPKASAEVVAVANQRIVARAQTDARGVFQLPVQSGGVYQINLADQTFTIRAWSAELAPPSTRDALLCVTPDETVRGQSRGRGRGLACFLTNPLVIGLSVAAAIAIPIVVDEVDDDDDELPSAS
jgi:hypothetical protein